MTPDFVRSPDAEAQPWQHLRLRWATVRDQYIVHLALFLLLLWLILTLAATIGRILSFYTALPYWDYWRIPQDLSAIENFDLSALWRQHNDHRIIFPEIVFAIDMLAFHGRLIVPLIVSFLSYVETWLLFSSSLFADRQLSRMLASASLLLAGVIALWQGSAAVLATPFQLQWTFVQLASACSLWWLWRVKETDRGIYLAGTIAAGVVANYSSGNGLLLWPVLLTIGWLIHLRRRTWVTLAIAAVLFSGLYFVGFQFGNDLNLRSLFTHPIYLIGYVGTYLAMPFAGMKAPGFGVTVGLVNLAVTILLFVVAWRRSLLLSLPGVLLFGSYAFTLLTILLTAAGRMDPSDPLFANAKPPRYITVPLMNWAVFILLSIWASARSHTRLLSPPVLITAFSVLLLLHLPKLRDWLALNSEDNAEQQLGALSLENGIVEANLIRHVFPSPEFVVNYLPELRERKLSIYYKSRERWLGRPVSQFAPALSTIFPGELSYIYPVRGGVELLGWADGAALHRAYTWIVLTNERGQIVGFGQRLPAGFPASVHADDLPPSLAWVGFANLTTPARSISAFVVDPRRGGLYPIVGSLAVPAITTASLEESVGQLPGIQWQMDSSWTPNRLPPRVLFGQGPPGVNYGSWSGDDRHTGQLTSSAFPTPANACLILPVLHGPQSGGLSVDVLDADTRQVIATTPIRDWQSKWDYWRVPIPAATRRVQIVARDDGKNWGEWVATADPLACR